MQARDVYCPDKGALYHNLISWLLNDEKRTLLLKQGISIQIKGIRII